MYDYKKFKYGGSMERGRGRCSCQLDLQIRLEPSAVQRRGRRLGVSQAMVRDLIRLPLGDQRGRGAFPADDLRAINVSRVANMKKRRTEI